MCSEYDFNIMSASVCYCYLHQGHSIVCLLRKLSSCHLLTLTLGLIVPILKT